MWKSATIVHPWKADRICNIISNVNNVQFKLHKSLCIGIRDRDIKRWRQSH